MFTPTSYLKRPATVLLATGVVLTALAGPAAAQQLYAGEEYVELAGFPAIAYFQAGEPDRPLIIFAPGAHHTARIAYGGHQGANPEDFLAHELVARGYNFLALSYPIATESGAFTEDHPEFTSQDWGRQIAEAATGAVEEHGLTGEIYVATWSMAGKVAQPAHAALQDAGHPLTAVLSFASTPGIPGIINLTTVMDRTDTGYVNREGTYPGWYNQILANAGDGQPIIPEDIYLTEYVGHMSGNQQGYGEVYHPDGTITIDHMAQAEDYGAFEFMNFPLTVNLQVDERADARHALLDHAYFAFYNTHTLLSEMQRRGISPNDLDDDAWQRVTELSRETAERLTVDVGGNHFFFVGSRQVQDTADAIETAVEKVRAWNDALDGALSR